MEHISQQLESVFRNIEQERMQDIPVCNPELQVQAIGFREWEDYYLGVMLTPWFMNLMLLPASPDVFANMKEGSKQLHRFPSGIYEFITGREVELGNYQVCSLFSPMHEFADQEIAEQTANQVLEALMESLNQDALSMKGVEDGVETQTVEHKSLEKARDLNNTAMSRRDFLRGGRRREGRHETRRGD